MTVMLNQDPEMIERMEKDLVAKVTDAYQAAGIEAGIHGVFSLDDLEQKTESDLCRKIAVGVGYIGADTTKPEVTAPQNVGRGVAARTLGFAFMIILAVPSEIDCNERHAATKLLTILRNRIMGATIDGDRTSRTWAFLRERPEVSQSTSSMLYYSQVWHVAIPSVGNINQS